MRLKVRQPSQVNRLRAERASCARALGFKWYVGLRLKKMRSLRTQHRRVSCYSVAFSAASSSVIWAGKRQG